jgi:hypothetical protein
MSNKVFLTVRSDAKRIPGQIIHYATVHDLNDRLCISATLDYVLAVAQERGYEFVGENPAEIERQRSSDRRRAGLRQMFIGDVESIGPLLDEDAGRDFDAEAEAHFAERSLEQ